MRVLGLDPSLTNYGWCFLDLSQKGKDRCIARGRWSTPASMIEVDRYRLQRQRLRRCLRKYRPDKVGIEYPVFGETFSEGMYALFMFSIEALRVEGFDAVFLANNQTKVNAMVSLGREISAMDVSKQDMVDAAKDHLGGGRWSGDEADAYWAAVTAGRFWGLFHGDLAPEDLTPQERHQFLNIDYYKRGLKQGRVKHKGILHRPGKGFHLWSNGPLQPLKGGSERESRLRRVSERSSRYQALYQDLFLGVQSGDQKNKQTCDKQTGLEENEQEDCKEK